MGVVLATCNVVCDVVRFWYRTFRVWHGRKSPVELWHARLCSADSYEDWEEAALQLDNLLGLDLWRHNIAAKEYDYRYIQRRLESVIAARAAVTRSPSLIVDTVRAGLVRNLANITTAKLYSRAFGGTKFLIEEYVTQIAEAIEDVCRPQHAPRKQVLGGTRSGHIPALSAQLTLDFVHNARQAFGRTTLVLQGGSVFGLCHIGVVRALHLRGLLPRIITGTATGALVAAFVAIHTDDELLGVLRGSGGIDLSAFKLNEAALSSKIPLLVRRLARFLRHGTFVDVDVLERCIHSNIGNVTFAEAYRRTKRILNITVATETQQGGRSTGVPALLNYLTTPDVLIWSAAVASNTTSLSAPSSVVLCKDPSTGTIGPWQVADTVVFRPWTTSQSIDRAYTPLTRLSHLFNVNHFIVSQARPHVVPFIQAETPGPYSLVRQRSRPCQFFFFVLHLVAHELRHRLRQLDSLQLLPRAIRRFLVSEHVPGATVSLTLVPEVTGSDYWRLLSRTLSGDEVDYWAKKGERSVWKAVAALRVRCVIEAELERSYHATRRLRPKELDIG